MKNFRINTQRLSLIEVVEDDLEDIFRIDSYKECDEFNTLGIPKSIEDTRKIYQSAFDDLKNEVRKQFCWKIELEGNIIGLAGLFNSADRFKIGEIYYKIAPDFWGKGLGSEVARGLIQFGFEILKLHRVEAGVAVTNHRSIKLLEKVGMQREGRHRKILPIRGEWVDNYHYAIVDEEFFENKN